MMDIFVREELDRSKWKMEALVDRNFEEVQTFHPFPD